jgi:hypothetical protein
MFAASGSRQKRNNPGGLPLYFGLDPVSGFVHKVKMYVGTIASRTRLRRTADASRITPQFLPSTGQPSFLIFFILELLFILLPCLSRRLPVSCQILQLLKENLSRPALRDFISG